DCNDGNECTADACTAGKCTFSTLAAGSQCATGVCNGTASTEKCVACVDTGAGATQDPGCTPAKPVCDASGSTPTCYECLTGSDCATDNLVCTAETCTNHVCSHVDITSQKTLIDADTIGNGSFELGTQPATGWAEDGKYWITKDCGATGCTPGSNSGKTKANPGKVLAWLGGILDAGVGDLSQTLVLPAGAQALRIKADTNFQTSNKTTANKDYFQVRLMDASYVQIGSPLLSKSNLDAVTGNTHPWVPDGVDVTVDVSAHAGKVVSISFWSSSDMALITDFFLDNVRVTATICP
ncbi:MAG TPA: hypothetical protein VGC79_30980, partial [Polyangiaceae bacterium]